MGAADKSAKDIVKLYENEGGAIFPESLREKLHFQAFSGAKYDANGVEATLQKYFGEVRLKDALKPVLVPAYDIEKQVTIFFKSWKAKASPDFDFAMRQVARATSAAPTYFPPEKIETADPLQYYALIDGGVVAGNPAMCAYAEAMKLRPDGAGDLMMVSFGTGEMRHPLQYDSAVKWGQIEWAQPVIDIALQGSNATVNYQLNQFLVPNETYFRFQVELSADVAEMDNAHKDNLKRLIDLTQDYLSQPDTQAALDKVCGLLTGGGAQC